MLKTFVGVVMNGGRFGGNCRSSLGEQSMRSEASRGHSLRLASLTATLTLLLGVGAVQASSISFSFNPAPLAEGTFISGPFSVTQNMSDGDRYQVTGSLTDTNSSNTTGLVTLLTNVTVTYLGNGSGTASIADDSLTIDFVQSYLTPFSVGSNTSGIEAVSGTFSGALGSGSDVKGQLSSNGTAMAAMGPFVPPSPFSTILTNQPFVYGPTTTLDFKYTFDFGANSAVNSAISVGDVSAVPEPVSLMLLGSGLIGAGVRRYRRRSR
jgi:hypothetical protein